MSEILKQGDHIAHVASWGVRETKSGAPQIFVKLDNGLTWFGSLNEGKAREITLKALFVMGFCGNDLDELVTDSDALDVNKDLRVVVEHDTDENGKIRAVAKWINEIGGGAMKGTLDHKSAVSALKGLKAKGDIMKLKKELNVVDREKKPTSQNDQETSVDEIPF